MAPRLPAQARSKRLDSVTTLKIGLSQCQKFRGFSEHQRSCEKRSARDDALVFNRWQENPADGNERHSVAAFEMSKRADKNPVS
jgi:hypothetical protein